MLVTLVGFVLPLCLDSFAVAAAVGAAGTLSRPARWRISALFVVFEAGMPLIGLALGAPLARAVGGVADYLAAAAVVAIGAWMLVHGDSGEEEENAGRMASARGVALLGLGLVISLDELAIGFSVGLARLPAVPVIAAIGVQAFVAAQLGVRLGARVGQRWREAAERVAGAALIALGLFLVVERLLG
jgi:manganese efflux pump family protein